MNKLYHRQTKPYVGHFYSVYSRNSSRLYWKLNRQTRRYYNTDHIQFSEKIENKKVC